MEKPVYFVVSVDTEEDNAWTPSCRRTPCVENLRYLDRFQHLCETFGIKPVYLCTQTIVETPSAGAGLRAWLDQGVCDIGTHLHVWTTDGHPVGAADDAMYELMLPFEDHRRMIQTLTRRLEDYFGKKMTAFRAGRYGQNNAGIRIIEELGYKVDTSVVPGHSYKKQDGGPDFSSAGIKPYFLSRTNLCSKGDSTVLEIPVTAAEYIKLLGRAWYPSSFPAILRRILRKLSMTETLWLRPTFLESRKAEILGQILLEGGKTDTMNFMVHSSEFMPGGSPYFKTETEVDLLMERIRIIFDLMVNRYRAKPVTYDELYDIKCKEK